MKYENKLTVEIQGTKDAIREELLRLIEDIDRHGKPIQGIYIRSDSEINITTPIWNGKKY